MPQATEALREKMQSYFGDPIDDHGPYEFLIDAGYKEERGLITGPEPFHEMTEKEGDCIDFLCQEWDYAYSCGKQEKG